MTQGKLQQLRDDMIAAKHAYDEFMEKNSRELTDDEKKSQPSRPMFGSPIIIEEPRMFELTPEIKDEMESLSRNMNDTKRKYYEFLSQKWRDISSNDEVISLLKQREVIDEKIRNLDEMALVNYELWRLNNE